MSDEVQSQILKECISAFAEGWGEKLPEDLETSVRRTFGDYITAKAKSLEGQDTTLEQIWKRDSKKVLGWITYKAEKTRKSGEEGPMVSFGDLALARNGIGDTEWC